MLLAFNTYQCLIRIWGTVLCHLKNLIWLATTCPPDQVHHKNCGIMTLPFIITAARTEMDVYDWLPLENWASDETIHLGCGKQVLVYVKQRFSTRQLLLSWIMSYHSGLRGVRGRCNVFCWRWATARKGMKDSGGEKTTVPDVAQWLKAACGWEKLFVLGL